MAHRIMLMMPLYFNLIVFGYAQMLDAFINKYKTPILI